MRTTLQKLIFAAGMLSLAGCSTADKTGPPQEETPTPRIPSYEPMDGIDSREIAFINQQTAYIAPNTAYKFKSTGLSGGKEVETTLFLRYIPSKDDRQGKLFVWPHLEEFDDKLEAKLIRADMDSHPLFTGARNLIRLEKPDSILEIAVEEIQKADDGDPTNNMLKVSFESYFSQKMWPAVWPYRNAEALRGDHAYLHANTAYLVPRTYATDDGKAVTTSFVLRYIPNTDGKDGLLFAWPWQNEPDAQKEAMLIRARTGTNPVYTGNAVDVPLDDTHACRVTIENIDDGNDDDPRTNVLEVRLDDVPHKRPPQFIVKPENLDEHPGPP